jgi:type II secretory pathway component PulF
MAGMKKTPHLPLPYAVRADLLHHLAALEHAGIAPLEAVPMIKLPAPWQERVVATRRAMARGQNIAKAGLQSGLWTPLEAGLLQAALAAGDPSPSYRRLGEYYTEKARQLKTMKSRLMLPAVMGLLSLFISPLPQLVAGSLSGGAYLWQVLRSVLVVGAGVTGMVYGFRRFQMRPLDARPGALDHILLAIPLFGRMHKRRNLCDFWQSLAMLLEAGLPMFEALPVALQSASNALLRIELARILPRMKKTATLAEAVRAIPAIEDDVLLGMIQVGEASGSLPEMLTRYANGENASLALQQEQVAQWVPRIIYAMIAAMIAWGILSGGAFNPRVPDNL